MDSKVKIKENKKGRGILVAGFNDVHLENMEGKWIGDLKDVKREPQEIKDLDDHAECTQVIKSKGKSYYFFVGNVVGGLGKKNIQVEDIVPTADYHSGIFFERKPDETKKKW